MEAGWVRFVYRVLSVCRLFGGDLGGSNGVWGGEIGKGGVDIDGYVSCRYGR